MTDAISTGTAGSFHQLQAKRAATFHVLMVSALCLALLLPAPARAQSAVGNTCTTNSDCAASNCIDGICCDSSCFGTCRSCAQAQTGQTNGTCAPVQDNKQSTSGCTGQVCSSIGCVPTGCFDGTKDGNETGVDCGGSCPGCGVGTTCATGTDCAGSNCIDGICCDPGCFGTCRSCAQAKTGHPDGTCAPVQDNKQSTSGCAGQVCSSIGCVPTGCFNGTKDGNETGVDCGGSCPGCGVGTTCATANDCAGSNCIDGVCCDSGCFGTCRSCAQTQTGQTNGTCAPVQDNTQSTSGCTASGKVCSSIGCVPTGCFNGTKDGDETGVDCGGSCPGCGVGVACKAIGDCAANNCVDDVCCEPSCFQTCRSCALATTGQPDGTCAQVQTAHQTTNGCNAVGQVCDDLGSCLGSTTATATPTATVTPTPPSTACVGDCNLNSLVTVDEILTMVNIALGNGGVTGCGAGDANNNGQITVDEILAAVNKALNGCP